MVVRLGRRFGWLWTAYAVSTLGTRLALDAFPLIAILVLHAGPTEVSALAAAGLAVGAAVAVPLGPWVEFRRKRPVMVAMDLTRFAALLSVPAAYALGLLGFAQLLVVSVIVAAADIAFRAARSVISFIRGQDRSFYSGAHAGYGQHENGERAPASRCEYFEYQQNPADHQSEITGSSDGLRGWPLIQ